MSCIAESIYNWNTLGPGAIFPPFARRHAPSMSRKFCGQSDRDRMNRR